MNKIFRLWCFDASLQYGQYTSKFGAGAPVCVTPFNLYAPEVGGAG